MKKQPVEIEELPDGAKRRDSALANALRMTPAPFTPKVNPKAKTKKKTAPKGVSKV